MRDLRVGMVTGYLHPLSHRSMKQNVPRSSGTVAMQHTRLRRLSPEAYESSVAALLAFVCLDDLQRGGARHGAAGSNKPRMDSLAAGAVHQCYMRRTVQHVLMAPFHQGEQHQRRYGFYQSEHIHTVRGSRLPGRALC